MWQKLDSVQLSTIFDRSVSFSWSKIEREENMDGLEG